MNGKRTELFTILKGKDLDLQLKTIEEGIFTEEKIRYSFSPPIKFFDRIAQVIRQTNQAVFNAEKL